MFLVSLTDLLMYFGSTLKEVAASTTMTMMTIEDEEETLGEK